MSVILQLTHNATDSANLTFFTRCPKENDFSKKTKCSDLKGGNEVDFEVEIEVCIFSELPYLLKLYIFLVSKKSTSLAIKEAISIDLPIYCIGPHNIISCF